MFEHCKQFADEYPMLAVDEIPELRENLVLLSTEDHGWTRIFECSECEQPWEESYTQHGHSDVPYVRKLGGVEGDE